MWQFLLYTVYKWYCDLMSFISVLFEQCSVVFFVICVQGGKCAGYLYVMQYMIHADIVNDAKLVSVQSISDYVLGI